MSLSTRSIPGSPRTYISKKSIAWRAAEKEEALHMLWRNVLSLSMKLEPKIADNWLTL